MTPPCSDKGTLVMSPPQLYDEGTVDLILSTPFMKLVNRIAVSAVVV